MNVLEIQNVSKRFGNLVAVSGVSLNVAKGELCAIIGPNGAGKTTFFNLISGFFPPTSGAINFDGRDITKLSTHQRVTLGMARTFQITEIFPESPYSRTFASPRKWRAGTGCGPGSTARKPQKPISMSKRRSNWCRWHGDQRAAEIAMALALNPHLLLLDEPTAGMVDQETYQITDGLDAGARRQDRRVRRGHHALADLSHRNPGRGLCAGGPPHLRQSQRRGESQGAAGTRRAVGDSTDLSAVSPASKSASTTAAASFPAANRRCCRSVARCC